MYQEKGERVNHRMMTGYSNSCMISLTAPNRNRETKLQPIDPISVHVGSMLRRKLGYPSTRRVAEPSLPDPGIDRHIHHEHQAPKRYLDARSQEIWI